MNSLDGEWIDLHSYRERDLIRRYTKVALEHKAKMQRKIHGSRGSN